MVKVWSSATLEISWLDEQIFQNYAINCNYFVIDVLVLFLTLTGKKIKSDGQARTSEFLKPTLGRPTKPVKPNQFSEPNDLVKYESKTDGMRAVAVSPASQKIPKRLKRRRSEYQLLK